MDIRMLKRNRKGNPLLYTNKTQNLLLYTILFGCLMLLYCFVKPGNNDDAWFAQILDKYQLLEYLVMRYEVWTSRVFIEIAEVYLTRWDPWIWKSINIMILLLLVYECGFIFGKIKNVLNTACFMSLIFLFPVKMLNSAGWISTTVNYIWPVTAGIFTLIPLIKHIKEVRIYKYEYCLSCIACIFACCQEQVAAVMFTVYVLYAGYCIYNKRRLTICWYVLFGISIFWLLVILSCPGNANRSFLETQTWFPEFSGVNFGEKLLIGILSTFSYYISCDECNMVFFLFSFMLILAVFYTTKRKSARVIAAVPFIVTAFWGFCGSVIVKSNITITSFYHRIRQTVTLMML